MGVMETEPVFNLKSVVSSPPAGYRFPREVIAVAVRWYLRYGLSYRDVEELLAERGIEVDHVTIYRWVQTFTAEFIDAARPARHAAGDRWFVDEVRHEALWIRVGVRDLHRRAVAAERLQLGVSLIRETPGRVGAALTTTGQVGTARRPGPG
jgi:transposase-like protein